MRIRGRQTVRFVRWVAAGSLSSCLLFGGTSFAQDGSIAHSEFRSDEGPTALERGRYAVLIDLDENRLYFKRGSLTLWSAPVGTGTAMRVITDADHWDFSTPNGRFQVEFKERNPVWIAPDWFYVENNLPIPPANDPSRYMTGTLGVAAIYISPSLAIHGTDRPELIGQRVSHGCIRLENRYAERLFHNVQVGTEVIIVGGEEARKNARVVDLREGYDPSLASKGGRPPPPADPVLERWKRMETSRLFEVLDEELEEPRSSSRWDQVAIILVDRAREGDDPALRGLLARVGTLPSERIELELATFVTELYRDATLRTLAEMSRIEARKRERIAKTIVTTMVNLYSGELDAPWVPWPSGRVPHGELEWRARRGLDAIVAAEAEARREFRRTADVI